ncbi:MAG: sterol carrier family protein [Kocuria sp.]|nr:sterol carrier family protein [Kocuria sp.]
MGRRRIRPADGTAALTTWHTYTKPADDGAPRRPQTDPCPTVARATLATAVRFSLEELSERAPGNSVEVRVPPYGVAQCIEGPRHTRGTPPNVIETDANTWLSVATGQLEWDHAVDKGLVIASGTRAELGQLLPLFTL